MTLRCFRSRTRSSRTAVTLTLAALFVASWLHAQSLDPMLRDFRLNGDYILVVDGKATEAEIYYSEQAGALLIMSSAFASPVLIRPRPGTAETVSIMKIAKKDNGTADLLTGAISSAPSPIQMTGDSVRFTADKKTAELQVKPPLLGYHSVYEVVAHNPEYKVGAQNYAPNSSAIASLRKEAQPVKVVIFYGSWCPHCRLMVPHAVKDEQLLRNTSVSFQYFGVSRNFGIETEVQKNKITAVPTGIIYLGGKEIGRIEGASWDAPEVAVVDALATHAAAAALHNPASKSNKGKGK
jgi:thiol-disulfide isomerase/thioredoxin